MDSGLSLRSSWDCGVLGGPWAQMPWWGVVAVIAVLLAWERMTLPDPAHILRSSAHCCPTSFHEEDQMTMSEAGREPEQDEFRLAIAYRHAARAHEQAAQALEIVAEHYERHGVSMAMRKSPCVARSRSPLVAS